MTHHPDGKPPTASASNGVTPLGPRVKRPGWRGWFLFAPDGTLVPDGHVEPVELPALRPGPAIVAPQSIEGEPCIKGKHPFEFRRLNAQGHSYCGECRRLARRIRRAASRIVAAAMAA